MPRGLISAKLIGGKELAAALDELPKALTKGVLRRAGRKALELVRAAAEQAAKDAGFKNPSGRYASSFTIGILNKNQRKGATKGGGKDGIDVYVGSTDRKAHLIEFGHLTRPKDGKKSAFRVAAVPILRPAFEENKEEVIRVFGEELWVELKKVARRLARQANKGTLKAKYAKDLLTR